MPPLLQPDSPCLAPAWPAVQPGLPAALPLPPLALHVAVTPRLHVPVSELVLQDNTMRKLTDVHSLDCNVKHAHA